VTLVVTEDAMIHGSVLLWIISALFVLAVVFVIRLFQVFSAALDVGAKDHE
jgi:hypothetical protein